MAIIIIIIIKLLQETTKLQQTPLASIYLSHLKVDTDFFTLLGLLSISQL